MRLIAQCTPGRKSGSRLGKMPSGTLTLEDLDGLRVVDLKEALKKRGLATDGKKVRGGDLLGLGGGVQVV